MCHKWILLGRISKICLTKTLSILWDRDLRMSPHLIILWLIIIPLQVSRKDLDKGKTRIENLQLTYSLLNKIKAKYLLDQACQWPQLACKMIITGCNRLIQMLTSNKTWEAIPIQIYLCLLSKTCNCFRRTRVLTLCNWKLNRLQDLINLYDIQLWILRAPSQNWILII
jgi:hypothetical protein